MAAIGFSFAWYAQDSPIEAGALTLGTLWAASIGFGFGTIFQQRRPVAALILYWAATLGLVGLFFGPAVPAASFFVRETVAGVIGALCGALVGAIQLWSLRKKLGGRLQRGIQS
jgi:hypothetical protein